MKMSFHQDSTPPFKFSALYLVRKRGGERGTLNRAKDGGRTSMEEERERGEETPGVNLMTDESAISSLPSRSRKNPREA